MCIDSIRNTSQNIFDSSYNYVIEPAVNCKNKAVEGWSFLEAQVEKITDENLPSYIAPIVQKAFSALPYIVAFEITPPLVPLMVEIPVMISLMSRTDDEVRPYEKNICHALGVFHSVLAVKNIVATLHDQNEMHFAISNIFMVAICFALPNM